MVWLRNKIKKIRLVLVGEIILKKMTEFIWFIRKHYSLCMTCHFVSLAILFVELNRINKTSGME